MDSSRQIIMSATSRLRGRVYKSGKMEDGRYYAEVTGLHRCEAATLEMAIADLAIWIRDHYKKGRG